MTLAGQVSTELSGGRGVLSCSKLVEEGARAALLIAPGRFRLDVRPVEDTLQVIVRALEGTPVRWRIDGPLELWIAPSAVELAPGAHALSVEAGDRNAAITIAVTHDPGGGVTRFVAQARID